MQLGCFWQVQGCAQAAFGENKGVFSLILAITGCVQAASVENKGVFRLL